MAMMNPSSPRQRSGYQPTTAAGTFFSGMNDARYRDDQMAVKDQQLQMQQSRLDMAEQKFEQQGQPKWDDFYTDWTEYEKYLDEATPNQYPDASRRLGMLKQRYRDWVPLEESDLRAEFNIPDDYQPGTPLKDGQGFGSPAAYSKQQTSDAALMKAQQELALEQARPMVEASVWELVQKPGAIMQLPVLRQQWAAQGVTGPEVDKAFTAAQSYLTSLNAMDNQRRDDIRQDLGRIDGIVMTILTKKAQPKAAGKGGTDWREMLNNVGGAPLEPTDVSRYNLLMADAAKQLREGQTIDGILLDWHAKGKIEMPEGGIESMFPEEAAKRWPRSEVDWETISQTPTGAAANPLHSTSYVDTLGTVLAPKLNQAPRTTEAAPKRRGFFDLSNYTE